MFLGFNNLESLQELSRRNRHDDDFLRSQLHTDFHDMTAGSWKEDRMMMKFLNSEFKQQRLNSSKALEELKQDYSGRLA